MRMSVEAEATWLRVVVQMMRENEIIRHAQVTA